MDPELIQQLRQALRAAGLNFKDDVRAYATSIGIDVSRSAKALTTAPAAAPSASPGVTQPSVDLENRKEQLIDQVSRFMSKSELAPYQAAMVNKIKAVKDRAALNQIGNAILDLITKYQKAQEAGPEAAKAFAGVVGSTEGIKKAEKEPVPTPVSSQSTEPAAAPSSSGLSEGQFVSLANQALTSKDYQSFPLGLVFYDETDTTMGVFFKQLTENFRDAVVVGLPSVRPEIEMLALGFGSKRMQALLVSDEGRPAHRRFRDLFEIRNGQNMTTIKPALRDSNTKEVIQKGIIELPLR